MDKEKTMRMLYVYAANQEKGKSGDVAASVLKNLQKDAKTVNLNFIDVQAVGTTPTRPVDNSTYTRRNDSGYDLTAVFEKIEQMTPEQIHAVVISPKWNGNNVSDFGGHGYRDMESKTEIIKGILKQYPELAGKFVSFSSVLWNPQMQKLGVEVFDPSVSEPRKTGVEMFDASISGEGTWAKLVQYMENVRRTQNQNKAKLGKAVIKAVSKPETLIGEN